ncbi:hypothetical protein KY290_005337 [Solanum tuberosum]|uniref:Uncharacterized protein n=1 Tax=Solanum tuberosum TaxID=4113 RepID=A0ABQ7WE85_SOLTU|nr:hypothetical protein KY289_005726 [Solanum tuberosum]KAH0778910.1 hypothetical protein KY290_005337 [Solanum tuberosum]
MWLYHNNQFFDCKHLTKKLALHFANDFNRINDAVNTLDMMRKLDKNFSYILCKLDNVQRALSTYSQSVIPDLVPLDVDSSYDNNGDLALSFDDSSPVFKDLVASDSNIVDECIQPSLQACVVQKHTYVILSNLLFDLNDETLEEVTGGTLEEVSRISTDKMFAGIPDRDIDMEVVDSIQNDVVKLETQVFDERCDSNNVVKFDEMLFALPCMISDGSSFAYLSELDPSKLPLSLYRFPPAQFKLEFPFDPGSGMLTTFLGSANCYPFMVADDFKEIIKMFVSHFNFTISDQYTLDQFPYDPGANVFIVTSGGRLQVCDLRRKYLGTVASEQFINLLELLLALNLVSLDVSTNYSDYKQLEKYDTLFRPMLIATNASAYAHRYDYVCAKYVASKKFLSWRIWHISVDLLSRSIKDNILYSGNISQLVLATIGRECATNIVLDSNLEDKVLIEDESIVMSQVCPMWLSESRK